MKANNAVNSGPESGFKSNIAQITNIGEQGYNVPTSTGVSDPCLEFGFSSINLPLDLINNLEIVKEKEGNENVLVYIYKGVVLSKECVNAIRSNKNTRLQMLIEQKIAQLSNVNEITKQAKKQILEKIDDIFKLSEFESNLELIETKLEQFLKSSTSINQKKSFEYHLLKIESFFEALENFEKKIDIQPFEEPKKVNYDEIKGDSKTEPEKPKDLKKIEIKKSQVTRLLDELSKTESFKVLDNLMVDNRNNDYLTSLYDYNYNNGNVLYNTLGFPNSYNKTSGIYNVQLPSGLNTLNSNYTNPESIRIIKPLIDAFKSYADIKTKVSNHINFKTYESWLEDDNYIMEIVNYFANSDSFMELKNFIFNVHSLSSDNKGHYFKSTGYFDDQYRECLYGTHPTERTAYALQVRNFEKVHGNVVNNTPMFKFFQKVIDSASNNTIWDNRGAEDPSIKVVI